MNTLSRNKPLSSHDLNNPANDTTFLTPLRILHLEDVPHDRELVSAALESEGIPCKIHHVETRAEFLAALESRQVDLVLSDHALPGFDGQAALAIIKEKCPHIPFVFVTGSLGEDAAIETIKSGATDYVLKNRLSRLSPAVRRAAAEAKERKKRKRAEEQIREQAALLDKARDAICVCTIDQSILYWNKSAETLYGWTVSEVLDKKADELLFRIGTVTPQEALKSVISKREWSGELHQVTKAGRDIVVESRWTLVEDDQGNPKSILIINTDVTEKKNLEAQFLRIQRLESIGTLAGGIAHDLNNVLAPILMGAQLLRMKLADSDCLKILDSLESSAQRGTGMVKQVLSFARGVDGERAVVQLKHIITEQEKIAHETFPRSIRLKKEIGANLWTIMGDATQLYQVLMNLCVNARDAMPNGGILEIKAENVLLDERYARMHVEAKPGPYVLLTVSDTGSGIPPQIIDKIFDPFFTTKEPGKGTGLGLSTVVGIVKSHGGFVSVYSEVGKGTQFKVYLPAVETSDTQQVAANQPKIPAGHGDLILVADDELTIREITKSTLETYNYRVITAYDGTEAMAVYAENKDEIKLVITDMSMPYLDGPATIRVLRRMNPHLKIIAVSGMLDNAKTADVSSDGTVKFLQKPYTTEKLLTLVHEMLAGS